jgi:hypothetical protein
MYLGFSQLPFAIGATIEGFVGQVLYAKYAAKDTISRDYLVEAGMTAQEAADVPIGEAFDRLVALTGQPAQQLTNQMYAANDVGSIFYIFAAVGIVSAFGLFMFGKWTYRFAMQQQASQAAE